MQVVENFDLIQSLKIAAPCSRNWYEMHGDDKRRFCHDCQLHVYNVSAMTRKEAVEFIENHRTRRTRRVCVRLMRRSDGTVITRQCWVGARLERAWLAIKLTALALVAMIPIGGFIRGALQTSISQSFSTVVSQTGALNSYSAVTTEHSK